MFATAGTPALWSLMAQSMSERIMDHVLPPEHPNTRTGTSDTFFATPHVPEPMVPATCVP